MNRNHPGFFGRFAIVLTLLLVSASNLVGCGGDTQPSTPVQVEEDGGAAKRQQEMRDYMEKKSKEGGTTAPK